MTPTTTLKQAAEAHISAIAVERSAERERCLKIISVEQRRYAGGSEGSIALGLAAIAIRNVK